MPFNKMTNAALEMLRAHPGAIMRLRETEGRTVTTIEEGGDGLGIYPDETLSELRTADLLSANESVMTAYKPADSATLSAVADRLDKECEEALAVLKAHPTCEVSLKFIGGKRLALCSLPSNCAITQPGVGVAYVNGYQVIDNYGMPMVLGKFTPYVLAELRDAGAVVPVEDEKTVYRLKEIAHASITQ